MAADTCFGTGEDRCWCHTCAQFHTRIKYLKALSRRILIDIYEEDGGSFPNFSRIRFQ